MFEAFPSTRRLAPTFCVADLVVVMLAATVVAAWAGLAAGAASFPVWLACEATFLSFYLTGSLVAAWRPLAAGLLFDLPLRLLVGYAVINSALFVLAWLSPLGIVANFGVLSGLIAAVFVVCRPTRMRVDANSTAVWAVLLALVAASLWCQDSICPMEAHGRTTIVKPWIDGFFHAAHIRMFSVAHGASSIQDIRMAGVPVRLYHYAAYFTPALIKQASGLPSYAAFAGILVPMGVFFTGLGAYVLVASFWGTWSGLAACGALLLLPDGAQQGMGNTFLSYHWLAQISPGATFGLTLVALSWLFVLRGSTRGSLLQVAVGWALGAALMFYKAHFFLAIALLLICTPPLFLRLRLRLRYRIAWLALAVTAFVTAVVISQDRPGLPVLRFDGSATGRLLDIAVSLSDSSAVKTFLLGNVGEHKSWIPNVVLGAAYLLFGVLGVLAPAIALLMAGLRKRIGTLLALFPLIIAGNFVVMALGMAMDTHHVGVPEDLQHRPLLLMYFVVVAWTGGAGALALLRSRRLGAVARPAIVVLSLLLLLVPAVQGANAQRLSTMPHETRTPIVYSQLDAMAFMRQHGSAADVFQASSLDPGYVIAALSDCQPYYSHQMYWQRASEQVLVNARINQVWQFMALRDPAMIAMTAKKMGLRWFLLFTGQSVAWPASIVGKPAFEAEGFKLYQFD